MTAGLLLFFISTLLHWHPEKVFRNRGGDARDLWISVSGGLVVLLSIIYLPAFPQIKQDSDMLSLILGLELTVILVALYLCVQRTDDSSSANVTTSQAVPSEEQIDERTSDVRAMTLVFVGAFLVLLVGLIFTTIALYLMNYFEYSLGVIEMACAVVVSPFLVICGGLCVILLYSMFMTLLDNLSKCPDDKEHKKLFFSYAAWIAAVIAAKVLVTYNCLPEQGTNTVLIAAFAGGVAYLWATRPIYEEEEPKEAPKPAELEAKPVEVEVV